MLREVLQKQLENLQEYQKVCGFDILDVDEYIRLSFAIQETAAKLEDYNRAHPVKPQTINITLDGELLTSTMINCIRQGAES